MKKILFVVGMALSVCSATYAQTETETEIPASVVPEPAQGQKLKEQLELTSAQETQLRQILTESRQARQLLKDNLKLTPEELKAGLDQIRLRREERIKDVLKPTQLYKWNGIKAKIQQAHKAQTRATPKMKPPKVKH